MNEKKLDAEEQRLLEEFDKGEWVSDLTPDRREQARLAAEQTAKLDLCISVNISSGDLDALQRRALEEGLPCESLVSSILHKYVSGGLVDAAREKSGS
mgnify:CR=1 FL=1